jgi:hypothetical protein
LVVQHQAGDLLMVDFRYHVVSLAAVLIALSVGVVLGTGAFGDPLLRDIRNNVRELEQDISDRRAQNAQLNDDLQRELAFGLAAEPYLLDGRMQSQQVVVVEFAGTDGAVADQLRAAVATAGGRVTSTIELLDRFVLADQVDADALALALGSSTGDPDDLRLEAASDLGRALASAAQGESAALDDLLVALEDTEFVDVEGASQGDEAVPEGAALVIIGGSVEAPAYPVSELCLTLASAASEREAPVIVGETDASEWGLVTSIREDGDTRDLVATADGIQGVAGRVAAILGLERAIEGEIGHYGRGEGAGDLLPPPATEG